MRLKGMIYRYVIWGGLLTGLVVFAAGCSKDKPAAAEVKTLSAPLTVTAVRTTQGEQYYETSGTVKANIVSKLAPKIMGEVTAVYVKSGDYVQAGQVLVDIADADIRQKLSAAEAGYREADKGLQVAERNRSLQNATYARYAKLYQQAAISQQQVDEIRTQYEMAELSYEQAAAARDRATASLAEVQVNSRLTAPISGIITEKTVEIGNMVQAGTPIVTVEDNHSYVVECYVAADAAVHVTTGLSVFFDTDNGKTLTGTVKEVVPSVDTASRSSLAKITLDSASLKSGQYGKVRFPLGQQAVLTVPQGSVVTKGQLTGVYVVDADKKVWYRLVRLGRQQDGVAEVVTGLTDGDLVVTDGVENAADGVIAGEVKGL